MHIEKIIQLLEKRHNITPSNWHTQQNPFQVLIGTVLSQRTRDSNTDKATKQLFANYPTPESLASAPVERIMELIKPSGFYRTKALRIKEIAKIVSEIGRVPNDIEELLKLPGVGRKTANCVLVYGHGLPSIPVDTHVHRISNRLGWVKTKRPEETERELMKILPKEYWIRINGLLVKHGQFICRPIKPQCYLCPIEQYCKYGPKTEKP